MVSCTDENKKQKQWIQTSEHSFHVTLNWKNLQTRLRLLALFVMTCQLLPKKTGSQTWFQLVSTVFRLIKGTPFFDCGKSILWGLLVGSNVIRSSSPPCNLSVFAFLMGANTKLSNDLKPITKPASHSFSNLPLPKVLDNLPPHYYRYLCADGLRLSRFFHIMSGFLPRPCMTVVHFNKREDNIKSSLVPTDQQSSSECSQLLKNKTNPMLKGPHVKRPSLQQVTTHEPSFPVTFTRKWKNLQTRLRLLTLIVMTCRLLQNKTDSKSFTRLQLFFGW